MRACVHCLSAPGGEKISHRFGLDVHGRKPNNFVQLVYVDLSSSNSWNKYVLMLRDDHSDYKWFFCFPNTDTENAAYAITDWSDANGVQASIMSEDPTHLKNETVRLASKSLKIAHHVTLLIVRGAMVLWNS